MTTNLTDPVFHDEAKAREFLELQRWPHGPVCPYCKEHKNVVRLGGEAATKGQVLCRPCRKKFTVTVGTVMERSHIPLTKWLMGFRLMAASKKGISAHQMHRLMGITYKTAWFLNMRVREAMGLGPDPAKSHGPLGVAKVAFLASGTTPEGVAAFRANARAKLEADTLPGVDAALADHVMAEIQSNVDRLIAEIETTVKEAWQLLEDDQGET